MTRTVSAARTAALVGDFDRTPAYLGLAEALRLLIGDGRIGPGTRLPSERDLMVTLGVSRTTVTRAYADLRESGYAEARQGSGTFTRLPGDTARAIDRALLPRPGDQDAIDLGCAASSASPPVAAAFADAAVDLPAHLGGHGYFPAGLPRLQAAIAETYRARGLPTDPGQIMVTPGALAGVAVLARALTTARDRVVVETPTYPNAADAMRLGGARTVTSPVDPEGWDLAAAAAVLKQTRPAAAYLVPDFQNPTGLLMSDAERETYADALRSAGTMPIVDETLHQLSLDDRPMPRPFAAFAPEAITVGSASKAFWGGLRLGWIRAPHTLMDRIVRARVTLDLGAPVFEQLVLTRLLADPTPALDWHRQRLREQRDALVDALHQHLPQWRFRTPTGGLAVWCELPAPQATAVAVAADRRQVIVTPGPVFASEGGLDRYLRIPFTRPPADLRAAVTVLADAWTEVADRPVASTSRSRVMVA